MEGSLVKCIQCIMEDGAPLSKKHLLQAGAPIVSEIGHSNPISSFWVGHYVV